MLKVIDTRTPTPTYDQLPDHHCIVEAATISYPGRRRIFFVGSWMSGSERKAYVIKNSIGPKGEGWARAENLINIKVLDAEIVIR